MKIVLAGNPNSGKTTLFNLLTKERQFVGNWPGVTVEKKEGILSGHPNITVTDLPGIYSLSSYTAEGNIARSYLVMENPDVIINIIDGTNLERNLYLSTQLKELNIPMVIAVNMADVLEKNKDELDISSLSLKIGCPVVLLSAMKGIGAEELVKECLNVSEKQKEIMIFSKPLENSISRIIEIAGNFFPEDKKRFFAIKTFERDKNALAVLGSKGREIMQKSEETIKNLEADFDDDSESIITDERYNFVTDILALCFKKHKKDFLTITDKIDRIVTGRYTALPLFAVIMFLVYFISVTVVGSFVNEWINESLFGKGWYFFNIGRAEYEKALYDEEMAKTEILAFEHLAAENGIEGAVARDLVETVYLYDDFGIIKKKIIVDYNRYMDMVGRTTGVDPATFGIWIPGIPAAVGSFLNRIGCAEWLNRLVTEGIVGGIGAVLGFLPQLFILFFFLAFLESCGYMARIAFITDRFFIKFGLSGKSFIPLLIGTGCSVSGIMASRTIENERDRKITIITTSFMPCSAKLPLIALLAAAIFKKNVWVAPCAYFIGIFAVILSALILKKIKILGDNFSPFIIELPPYRLPTLNNIFMSVYDRTISFVKKAGSVILLASVFIWFASNFGYQNGVVKMTSMEDSFLAFFGRGISILFIPLGWGFWQATVASFTGLAAKENIVSTLGILLCAEGVAEDGGQIWENLEKVFTPLSAFSFLVFNLLCAPCVAAVSAIKKEMNHMGWTVFAIFYQCVFAYTIALIIYQVGMVYGGNADIILAIFAFSVIVITLFLSHERRKKK